jgi:hypothetical protein
MHLFDGALPYSLMFRTFRGVILSLHGAYMVLMPFFGSVLNDVL